MRGLGHKNLKFCEMKNEKCSRTDEIVEEKLQEIHKSTQLLENYL